EYASVDILLPGATSWIQVQRPTNLAYVSVDRFKANAGITVAIICKLRERDFQICFGPPPAEEQAPLAAFVGPPSPVTTRVAIKKNHVHWRESIEDDEEVFLIRPNADGVELIDTSQQA